MCMSKTLDDIIAKIRLPPRVAGLVSLPLTFSSFYFATNFLPSSPFRGTWAAPVISTLASIGISEIITTHFNEKKALRELGIEERGLKKFDEVASSQPEKERNLAWRVSDFFLTHPKLSGIGIGAVVTAYRLIRSDIVGIASSYAATGKLGRFLLVESLYQASVMAFLSYVSYFGVKYLSNMASSYDASTFFKLFPALFADNKTKIKVLSEQIRKKPSRFLRLSLATLLMKENKLDVACEQAKEALSAPNQPFLATQRFSETVKTAIGANYPKFRKNASDLPSAIFLAWCCNELGHPEAADDVLRQMARAANSAEASALSALWLSEAFGRKEAAKAYWMDSALRLVSDDSAIVLPVGEGVNHVYRIGGEFMRSVLIFKEQPLSAREDERRVLAYVASLPKEAKYTQPNEVAAFTYQKGSPRHALVLQYVDGKTLLEKAREGAVSYGDLLAVIDYASFLYRNLPLSLSQSGKIYLKSKLESIVDNPSLGLEADLRERIKRHAEFIADDLTGYDIIALDPHAGNWHFGEDGRTSKLDYSAAKDSLFRDLSKLFAHPELQIKDDDTCSLQGEAFERCSRDCFMPLGESDFRRLHLEGMLFQALSFASAWSVPEMSHMRGKREAVLAGASQAFKLLRSNHYGNNKLSYGALESDFMRAREAVAAQN